MNANIEIIDFSNCEAIKQYLDNLYLKMGIEIEENKTIEEKNNSATMDYLNFVKILAKNTPSILTTHDVDTLIFILPNETKQTPNETKQNKMTDYSVTELDLSYQNLTILPDLSLYTKLQQLWCGNNQLTSLNKLPPTLQELYCANNQLTSLDHLPPNLQILHCEKNKLTSLNNLPLNLQELDCSDNELTSLNNLPPNLQILDCSDNDITYLDIPDLQELYCVHNPCYNDYEHYNWLKKLK